MNENWAVTAEFVLGFDLTADQLGEIAVAIDGPCSWDDTTRRFAATISVRDTPVDAVLARSVWRIVSAVLQTADLDTGSTPSLVAIEALTFEEQDRRLARPS